MKCYDSFVNIGVSESNAKEIETIRVKFIDGPLPKPEKVAIFLKSLITEITDFSGEGFHDERIFD